MLLTSFVPIPSVWHEDSRGWLAAWQHNSYFSPSCENPSRGDKNALVINRKLMDTWVMWVHESWGCPYFIPCFINVHVTTKGRVRPCCLESKLIFCDWTCETKLHFSSQFELYGCPVVSCLLSVSPGLARPDVWLKVDPLWNKTTTSFWDNFVQISKTVCVTL